MKTVAFFNNKGGVGKTSLVYHLAWMYANLGVNVVGPNLGAFNRAALVAADHVVVPLAPDLYSLQGLRNLGPTLRRWRREWAERHNRNPVADLDLPRGEMQPAGYVVMQHAVRLDRPVKAYAKWMERIPSRYHSEVLKEPLANAITIGADSHCLATLKHFRSLMPFAQKARKPMFALTPADGAIGGHVYAVRDCYRDFRDLARSVAKATDITLPAPGPRPASGTYSR